MSIGTSGGSTCAVGSRPNGVEILMTAERLPSIEEAIEEIKTKPVVPVWPTVGLVLGLSRGATYDALRRGEIDVVKYGRLYKAVTSSLRRKLGIEAAR